MTGPMHIVRKDVRRLRWLIVFWLAVLLVRMAMMLSGTAPAVESLRTDMFLRQLSEMVAWMEPLLTALIVVRLVQDEPLVGLTAFWLTRPYDRGALMRAKLLFAIVVLVLLPLLADLAAMASLGARTPALARAGLTGAAAYLAGTLSVMVIAAMTPSLVSFVVTLLGIVAGLGILLSTTVGVATFWAVAPSGYGPPGVPDATRGVVMLAVYLCAALMVVIYQYRRRHLWGAVSLAVAGYAATMVIPTIWPWSFARAEEVRPGAWAAKASAAYDPSWGTEMHDVRRFGPGEPTRRVAARLTLAGAPPQVTVQQIGVRGRFRLPDGTTIESAQPAWFGLSFRTATVEAALGGVRLLQTREVYEDGWTPMLTLTEVEFARHKGQSGRLEADVYFELLRTHAAGSLPLTRGASLDDGVSRLEILDVVRRTGGRDIAVRRWRAGSLLSAERPVRERLFALRNRRRGEALMGGVVTSWATGRRSTAALMLLQFPLGASMQLSDDGDGAGFAAVTTFLRFPGPGFGKAPALDADWFDEAELVVLETEWAGVVTRPLVIDQFPIPAN